MRVCSLTRVAIRGAATLPTAAGCVTTFYRGNVSARYIEGQPGAISRLFALPRTLITDGAERCLSHGWRGRALGGGRPSPLCTVPPTHTWSDPVECQAPGPR